MKNLDSFLKQCIAEVIVEPTKRPSLSRNKKLASFIKMCIAEVIVEPVHRKTKIYGKPRRLQAAHLIKECIVEVLKENLTEGFDPLSQGPNPTQENPYPEWNAKMRTLEGASSKEEDSWVRYQRGYKDGTFAKNYQDKPFQNASHSTDMVYGLGYHDGLTGQKLSTPELVRGTVKEGSEVIYKDREGGQWVYWMDNRDTGGKIRINPANVEKYLKRGYRLVTAEPWNDPKAVAGLRKENEHGRYAQQAGAGQFDPRTFRQLTKEAGSPIELISLGVEDDWSRPVYRDQNGRTYVDVNLGNGTPSIHTVTGEGEPDTPVKNFTIKQASAQERHPNALCPRCKNSRPDWMENHPDGTKTCTFCHWSNSSIKEWTSPPPEQNTLRKVRNEVYTALAVDGWQKLGDEPRDYMEYYLSGFVTVSIFISYDNNAAHIERYYDSETIDQIPGHHLDKKIPIPESYSPEFVKKLITLCKGLKKRAVGDESIFGGMDDLTESSRSQSSNVQWTCPHCKKPTNIPVEIESPSDYIACADCEHCGKEISDPRLDQQVYNAVIQHYADRAGQDDPSRDDPRKKKIIRKQRRLKVK